MITNSTHFPEEAVHAKECRCGYSRDHSIVVSQNTYSVVGWLLWSVGISSRPLKVRLYCPVCQHTFHQTTEAAECERYRYR